MCRMRGRRVSRTRRWTRSGTGATKAPDAGSDRRRRPRVFSATMSELVLELADAMTRDIEVPDATDGTAARALRRAGSRRGRRHRRRLQHGVAFPGGAADRALSPWRWHDSEHLPGLAASRAPPGRAGTAIPETSPGIMPAMTSPPLPAPISPREKARILAEALPFIRAFHASTLIIRFGGGAMADPGAEGGLRARRRAAAARRHESDHRPRRRMADRRSPADDGHRESPASTACASPTRRRSTSSRWCWARSIRSSSGSSTGSAPRPWA